MLVHRTNKQINGSFQSHQMIKKENERSLSLSRTNARNWHPLHLKLQNVRDSVYFSLKYYAPLYLSTCPSGEFLAGDTFRWPFSKLICFSCSSLWIRIRGWTAAIAIVFQGVLCTPKFFQRLQLHLLYPVQRGLSVYVRYVMLHNYNPPWHNV